MSGANNTYSMPRHIEDRPSETDSFGGHEKIAAAIKEIIDSHKNENQTLYHRKPIGLLGNWGSGKSSVVKNLHTLYLKRPTSHETLIFEFDAWVYENDPIRRSFLEALLNFLEENGKTKLIDWEDDLNRIRRQSETHVSTSTPSLTKTGRTFAVSMMFFPIGLALIGGIKDIAWWWIPITAALVLSPFITFFGARLKSWSRRRKNDKPVENDPASLFFKQTTDTVTNNIIKTPDPTAIEFQEIFSKILNTTLLDKETRLIVVVDNLDRLPEEAALALWATMRSFFVRRDNKNKHFNNLWVIVPLDPISLFDLFSKDEASVDKVKAKVKSYIEKTFEITMRVGPPVLSTWEDFLVEKGGEAFDRNVISEDQWRDIARLYEVCMQNKREEREIITPRKIVSLVNSISSLYRIWSDFPVEVLAFYAIFKDKIEENIHGITQPDFLPSEAIAIVNNPEWKKYIAALYYNTEPEKAVLILISDPLSQALRECDINEAEKLINIPGGNAVVENIVQKLSPIWAKAEPRLLFNMSYSLFALQENDLNLRENSWRYLSDSALKIEGWQSFQAETSVGISSLLNSVDETRVNDLAQAIVFGLEKIQNQSLLDDVKNTNYWLDCFFAAEQHLLKQNNKNISLFNFNLPENIKFRANISLNLRDNT